MGEENSKFEKEKIEEERFRLALRYIDEAFSKNLSFKAPKEKIFLKIHGLRTLLGGEERDVIIDKKKTIQSPEREE